MSEYTVRWEPSYGGRFVVVKDGEDTAVEFSKNFLTDRQDHAKILTSVMERAGYSVSEEDIEVILNTSWSILLYRRV